MRQVLNLTYFQVVEGMDTDQRLDFDYTLVQPPERSHMRRPRGAGALMERMSGNVGRR